MDILSRLPAELSEYVLSFLNAQDLLRASAVCKSWYEIANTDFLWKALCTQKGINDEILVSELLKTSEVQRRSRWALLYRNSDRRAKKWSDDSHTWLGSSKIGLYVHIHGPIMALADTRGVNLFCVNDDDLIHFQDLPISYPVFHVMVSGDTVICDCESVAFVYVKKNCIYDLESVIVPHKNLVLSTFDSSVITQGVPVCTKIVTSSYIWITCMFCCKVCHRISRNIDTLELIDVVAIKHNGKEVAILRPSSIQIHTIGGVLLQKLNDFSFYTGLVMSINGIAFLQCEDFCDPEAVYFDLKTKSQYIENKLKVYKLALYKENLLCLTGQNQFSIVSETKNKTNWTITLQGSKYLRPGKDFFEIICSRYIFVCPSLGRIDMFSLYDLTTGQHIYDTSLNTATYNIVQVTNSGLLIKTKNSIIKLKSYI